MALYRPATVYADWNDKTYAAEIVAGDTWNGWVIPRFTKAVAEEIVRDQEDMIAAYGADAADRLEWEIDGVAIMIFDSQEPDSEVRRYFPDEDGMYHVGAMNWTWSEAI